MLTPPKTTTSSRVVYENPWITIHEDITFDQNGSEGIYSYLESKDSCMIVAVDDRERICLVKAFRYPSKSWGWELPGGSGEGESLIKASKRELAEETGITAKEWRKLGEAYVCNGLMSEKMSVCLASNLAYGSATDTEESFDAIEFFAHNQVQTMIRNGDINDCQTLAGLQYYEVNKRKE